MKAKNEFEYLVALLQEYIERMPPATKLAVASHAQQCINAVSQELNPPEEQPKNKGPANIPVDPKPMEGP